MKYQSGFTLVELVTVIILLGILAVNVLPKFDGTNAYEAHSHRAQLISALRLTQQRAMQQTRQDNASGDSYCHHLIIENSRYGVPNRIDCDDITLNGDWNEDKDITGHVVDSRYNITFSVSFVGNAVIAFDWLGRPIGGCANGCIINVASGVETLTIQIEPEGYIHGL